MRRRERRLLGMGTAIPRSITGPVGVSRGLRESKTMILGNAGRTRSTETTLGGMTELASLAPVAEFDGVGLGMGGESKRFPG